MGMAVRRGRPQKVNVIRDSSGKSRGEIVDFSVVFNQPHRRLAKDPKSELLGYPLGRLRLGNQISEQQHRAGNEWAMLVRSYAGTMGMPMGSPKSGSALNDASKPAYAFSQDEATDGAEDRERRVQSLRSRYAGCFERLAEVGLSIGVGRELAIAMRKVCIEERYPTDNELGNLRIGLNAIARELRISE